MENKKNYEIVVSKLKKSDYKKPERKNSLIENKEYDKIEKSCEKFVGIYTTGQTTIEAEGVPNLFGINKSDG